MLRAALLSSALVLCASVASAAPATVTRTVVQRRSVFDLVGAKTDLGLVCAGQRPLAVELKRTAGDVAAALFSGLWYTPVHLRVTCASP
ncbi:MAG: hypothetical protein ACXVDD_02450 [Polyangia bacterium]